MFKKFFCENCYLRKSIASMTLITILTVGFTSFLSAASYKDSQVKAVYLFNFINYVKWPIEKQSTNLCVIGSDSVGFSLALISEKSGNDYGNIEVEKRDYNSHLDDCHIIFIGKSIKDRLGKILYTLGKTPALTVSDISGFIESGGMVGFLKKDGNLKIEINIKNVKNVNLKVGSPLLKIANRVL